jgi:predicted dehydrogenase
MAGSIKVAVIGLGMGRQHAAGYATHPEAKIVALCDADGSRLEEAGKAFGVRSLYGDWRLMLEREKPDVVSVATPNHLHKEMTCAALEAGAHVLCEKPMAMNAVEAMEMRDLAADRKKRLMIHFSYRFHPTSAALKAYVDQGALGDVYAARTAWHRRRGLPPLGNWFCRKSLSGGGPLIDLGVHRIDLALWLMGYPEPTLVVGGAYGFLAGELAREAGKPYDVEDMATGLVRFGNGATLQVEASWTVHRPEAELMETWLYGKKGGLVQRNVGGEYRFEALLFTRENGCNVDKRISDANDPVPAAQHHFIESILRGTPHMATADEGVKVMRILDGFYESARTGAAVALPPAATT